MATPAKRLARKPVKSSPRKPARASKASGAFRIRAATVKDVPTILHMIQGLAVYEKLAHQMRATPALIRKYGFGKRRLFQVLLAERGKTPVGFALYYFTFSTFLARPSLYLEDLFVPHDERGAGIGYALLKALAREALKNGCERMDWLVLEWNRPAIDFYKHLGAMPHPDWIPTRLTGDALRKLAKG